MPQYNIEHICPLTESQKDELAAAITHIHSSTFSTPKLFVNVLITDASAHTTYVAGKRRRSNRIYAYVRHGPSRTQDHYAQVARQIEAEWKRIVPLPRTQRCAEQPDDELRMVMFFGAITAGYEAGFMVPVAGGDAEWLKTNLPEFEKRAEAGDEEFGEMVTECRERGLIE